jgi:hypothetical protein
MSDCLSGQIAMSTFGVALAVGRGDVRQGNRALHIW